MCSAGKLLTAVDDDDDDTGDDEILDSCLEDVRASVNSRAAGDRRSLEDSASAEDELTALTVGGSTRLRGLDSGPWPRRLAARTRKM